MGPTPTCVKIASDHCPRLHPPCVSRETLCVCVCVCVCLCVFAISCSPNYTLRPPDVHSTIISLAEKNAYMCQDCFRSLPEAPSTLCITRDTVCVCLCVFAIACSPHPPLRPPDAHRLLVNSISGGPRLHVSSLLPIIVRCSIHPVYYRGHCVCVCVCVCIFECVCHCLLPQPHTAYFGCS